VSANASQRRARNAILSARASDYRDWTLLAACKPCERQVWLPLRDRPGTVGDVVRRLRCQACRRRPTSVRIDCDLPGWRRRTVRLEGPGAYG
jgi:hypothetical protein